MSYRIYSTKGFILSEHHRGDDDVALVIFSQDFGKIIVLAKGARKISSKLRMSLQIYNFVQMSLVRGKEVWRVVDASPLHEIPSNITQRLSRIFMLASRLSVFDEPSENIFNILESFVKTVLSNNFRDKEFYVDAKAMASLLKISGYLKKQDEQVENALMGPFNQMNVDTIGQNQKVILDSIKNGIEHIGS